MVSWLVMPESSSDDPTRTYYKTVAIVRGDDGKYHEIDYYTLNYAGGDDAS